MNFPNVKIQLIGGKVPPLSEIIKKLDPSSKNKSDVIDQVVIKYTRSRSFAEKLAGRKFSIASLLNLGGGAEYYLVDVYQNATVSVKKEYKVTHPDFGDIELVFEFNIGAKDGLEVKLATELLRRDTPASLLEDKLNGWIQKGITENVADLYKHFGQFSQTLVQYFNYQATAIGLRLQTNISFKGGGPGPRETIRPSVKDIPVQPKGYNSFINLGFDVVMIPDKKQQEGTLVAIGHKNRADFQDLLVLWMQEYVREDITYNALTTHLHERVREGLIAHWNRQLLLKNKGWLVAELVLHSADVPAASFKFERIEIMADLLNARIPMTNTVILNLEDAERYKNSRIENLEVWIKDKLQQATQNVLARVLYAKLVSDILQLASIIKSDLDKQAQRIGYRVEYLLTSELVDKARLAFKFEFGEEEQLFQTSLNDTVNLNVIIAGKIKSLNHPFWLENLTPETDFVQEMKKEVHRIVRQELFRIDANDFYTQFSEIVEPRLGNNLKNLLVSYFNVDSSVDVFLKIGNSPISQLIKDLQRGQHSVVINLFRDAASYRITFRILNVEANLWGLFASSASSSATEAIALTGERIRVYVENTVRHEHGEINALKDSRLFFRIKDIAMDANMFVRQNTGLNIEIVDVEELANLLANKVTAFNLEAAGEKIERLLNAIKEVDKEIDEAYLDGDDEWVKELETKKLRLKKRFDNEKFEGYRLSQPSAEKLASENPTTNETE